MSVQCKLCPKGCSLEPGESGDCRVRRNIDGKLTSVVYGYVCAAHVDPVEKKPLFHFLPRSNAFSIATAGCNLHCLNCQNWEISQSNPEDVTASYCPPEKVVEIAKQNKCPSIAYTYTDPVVFYEYTYDTSVLAHKNGIKNILITAGYINPEPWEKLLDVSDAANINLKSIRNEFYVKNCSGTLKPIQEAIVAASKKIHLEVTNLIIPTLNDDEKEIYDLVSWHKEALGPDIPLHFSAFFPKYKMKNLPPTPLKTLQKARDIALKQGLNYVYAGNVMSGEWQNTYCPECKKLLVERTGYEILQNNIADGKCPCGKKIYGAWK